MGIRTPKPRAGPRRAEAALLHGQAWLLGPPPPTTPQSTPATWASAGPSQGPARTPWEGISGSHLTLRSQAQRRSQLLCTCYGPRDYGVELPETARPGTSGPIKHILTHKSRSPEASRLLTPLGRVCKAPDVPGHEGRSQGKLAPCPLFPFPASSISASAVPTCKVGTEDEMQSWPPPQGGVRLPKKTSATLLRGWMKGAVCAWGDRRRFIEESNQDTQSTLQSHILSLFIGET